MATKGIVLTVGILAAITAASFLLWFIPQNNEMIFVVSDFESHLDDVKEMHGVIVLGIEEEFQNMLNGNITPEQYVDIAEISSSQINSQIIRLVESGAPEEWYESYLNYIESLKKFNSQIRETIVVANMIKQGAEKNEIQNILDSINELNSDSKSFAAASDEARP